MKLKTQSWHEACQFIEAEIGDGYEGVEAAYWNDGRWKSSRRRYDGKESAVEKRGGLYSEAVRWVGV